MAYRQVESGWQAGSGHGPEGASYQAAGWTRRTAYMASVPVLLILVLPKKEG